MEQLVLHEPPHQILIKQKPTLSYIDYLKLLISNCIRTRHVFFPVSADVILIFFFLFPIFLISIILMTLTCPLTEVLFVLFSEFLSSLFFAFRFLNSRVHCFSRGFVKSCLLFDFSLSFVFQSSLAHSSHF